LARRLPSGLKATLVTALVWPLRVRASWPVAASHTFTVWSHEPLARRLPSGLKATLVTALVWPLRVRTSWPVAASHTLTVPYSDPPFGLDWRRFGEMKREALIQVRW